MTAFRGLSRHYASTAATATESARKFFVGGNWKANGSSAQFAAFADEMKSAVPPAGSGTEVVLALPSLFLEASAAHLERTSNDIHIAAQDCRQGGNGAHTGETTADMLMESGIGWTLTGHSERRTAGESNELVAAKTLYALQSSMKVVPCVGEQIEQRESGSTFDVVASQVGAIASAIESSGGDVEEMWSRTVIAYEPVWAIGTGLTATPDQAQEVHAYLRNWLASSVSPAIADATRIVYGGSVNGGNCVELAKMPDIDGFLVGGASLKPEFQKIMNAAA